jgi:hypothetical protein
MEHNSAPPHLAAEKVNAPAVSQPNEAVPAVLQTVALIESVPD